MLRPKEAKFAEIKKGYDTAKMIETKNATTIRLLKAKVEIENCTKEELDDVLKYYEKKYEELVTELEDISWKQTKANIILKSTQEYINKKKNAEKIVEEIPIVYNIANIQDVDYSLKEKCDQNADQIRELIKQIKEIKQETNSIKIYI